MKKMKKFNKYIIIVISVLLINISCTSYVEDYFTRPNGIEETTSSQQLLAIELSNQFFHKADGLRLAMMWMNQARGANRQYLTLDNWNNASGNDFDGPWNEIYLTITRADELIKMAEEEDNDALKGIGQLFKAWGGGEAASLWGDVPFSQVNNPDQYPDPEFEDQSVVFDQVQSLLDDAINNLSTSGFIFKQNLDKVKDIYFNGNSNKWIKIAHGLKAKFYLHSKDYANALSEAMLGPSSVGDDLYAIFSSDQENDNWGEFNPTAQFNIQRAGDMNAENVFAFQLFSSRGNNKTNDSGRKNYNYGTNNLNTSSNGDKAGKFFGKMPMITYGEMLLIATECKLRESSSNAIPEALNYYNTYRALLRAGEYMGGYSPGQYDDYDITDFEAGGIENSNGALSTKEAFMREIFEERYLYFIGDYESFIDFARSFNDNEVPEYMELRTDNNGNPKYENQPLRFLYPQVDEDANSNFPGRIAIDVPLPIYQ
jgi:hypothetical protein